MSAPTHADSTLVAAIVTPARANRQSVPGQKWQPCSGDKEDFIRVWALDLSSWGKSAHINVAGVGRVWAGHESGLSGDGGSIGNVSRRGCRGRRRLWRGTRGSILRRRRLGRRSWCRSGRRIGELGLRRLSPLIPEPVRGGRSISAALAAALTGCKHDQECSGGDDPGRRFHGDSFTKHARLGAKLQCKSCSGGPLKLRLRTGSSRLEERSTSRRSDQEGVVHGDRPA